MACTPPVVIVEGLEFSTDPWANAKDAIEENGSDTSDPLNDAHNESIAGGNNTAGTKGMQTGTATSGPPTQTTDPSPITQKPSSSDDKIPPVQGIGVTPPAPYFPVSLPDPLYSFHVSPDITVKDLCYSALEKTQLIDVSGFTALQRLQNMTYMVWNIVLPLREKFGASTVRMNSVLRNQNTVRPPGLSQHYSGEAVDIQFIGWTFQQYWDNAPWVRDNIKYDQFIFEHSNKTQLAWYHLSYKHNGGRAPGDRTKLMTMYNNQYSPGLQRHF